MHKVIPARFIFAENRKDLKGAGYIIEMLEPFYVGRVLTFKDQSEYLNSSVQSLWPVGTVPGYMIFIQYAGSLDHETRLRVDDETHGKIEKLVEDMALFYLADKIERHLGYYKKFYIKTVRENYKKRF